VSLVKLGVASKTQGGYAVVVSFKATTLAISTLVGVGGNNCAVLSPAMLTGGLPDGFK
jgi:hypothetical protein